MPRRIVPEDDESQKIEVVFWESDSGTTPVERWLDRDLDDEDRKVVLADITSVRMRWPIGMPVVRPLSKGLFEIRSSLPSDREARIFFCTKKGRAYLLHAFFKTTQETPARELNVARRRQKGVR